MPTLLSLSGSQRTEWCFRRASKMAASQQHTSDGSSTTSERSSSTRPQSTTFASMISNALALMTRVTRWMFKRLSNFQSFSSIRDKRRSCQPFRPMLNQWWTLSSRHSAQSWQVSLRNRSMEVSFLLMHRTKLTPGSNSKESYSMSLSSCPVVTLMVTI